MSHALILIAMYLQMISSTEGLSSVGLVDTATSITATSVYVDKTHTNLCQPADIAYSLPDRCWCSDTAQCTDDPILTIQLGDTYTITKLGVKACSWPSNLSWGNESVTSYKMSYYHDNTWTWYNNSQSLQGNNGCCEEEVAYLSPVVIATQIRMHPLSATTWCSSNFEVYGYPLTHAPTSEPTFNPIMEPTLEPTLYPTMEPTSFTANPSVMTLEPTINPTIPPSLSPSMYTIEPTHHPTNPPSRFPTTNPTSNPTRNPTFYPTMEPTIHPTIQPTITTANPSMRTHEPTLNPTIAPSLTPSMYTMEPTRSPSNLPSSDPSQHPAMQPTIHPTEAPSGFPSAVPSDNPSLRPTLHALHTKDPTTREPSFVPSVLRLTYTTATEHSVSENASSTKGDALLNALIISIIILFLLIITSLTFWYQWDKLRKEEHKQIELGEVNDFKDGIGREETAELAHLVEFFTDFLSLPQYLDVFIHNGYFTLTQIQDIETTEQLANEFGISDITHQEFIISAINGLRTGDDVDVLHLDSVLPSVVDMLALPLQTSNPETPSTTMKGPGFEGSDGIRLIPGLGCLEIDKTQDSEMCVTPDSDGMEGPILIDCNAQSDSDGGGMEHTEGPKQKGNESDDGDSDNFDDMFVKEESQKAPSPVSDVQTTKGGTEKVGFHGTKGEYYDEYNHEIYKQKLMSNT
eukprot:49101_1